MADGSEALAGQHPTVRVTHAPTRVVRRRQVVWDPREAGAFDKWVQRTESHWWWTGYVDPSDGYGRFKPHHNSVTQMAHNVAYVRWVGVIPDTHVIDHKGHTFRERRCVRPEHLEAVPEIVNKRRGGSFAGVNYRKETCPQGHPYDAANTHILPSGRRRCLICRRAQTAAYKTRQKGSRS